MHRDMIQSDSDKILLTRISQRNSLHKLVCHSRFIYAYPWKTPKNFLTVSCLHPIGWWIRWLTCPQGQLISGGILYQIQCRSFHRRNSIFQLCTSQELSKSIQTLIVSTYLPLSGEYVFMPVEWGRGIPSEYSDRSCPLYSTPLLTRFSRFDVMTPPKPGIHHQQKFEV